VNDVARGLGLRRELGPMVRAVLVLAVPAIGQSFMHTLLFLVDRAMLGRFSADALASMQISGPLVWSIYSVLLALSVGSIALVGRATGSNDRALAGATARASLGLAIVTGVAAGLAGLACLDPLLDLFLDAGPAVREQAHGYLVVVLSGMPLLVVSLTLANVLAAAGDTRTPFYATFAGNLLNAGLNWVFIFGNLGAPRLGAQGSALASVIALLVQVVVLGWALARRDSPAPLRGRGGEREAIARMLRVAWPAFFERVVQHTGFFGYVLLIGALGAHAMAANQALVSIESICFLSGDGFGLAAAAIVAQRLGAGSPREAKLGGAVSVALAVALLSIFALAFVAVPGALLSAFTDDADIVRTGIPCLYVAAVAQPFMAAGIVLAQALRGAGATRVAFVSMLVGGLFVRLAATWLFAFELDLGLAGVWLGSTTDWIVRVAILTPVFLRGRWTHAAV
jgi:putative MATE family efflux protein